MRSKGVAEQAILILCRARFGHQAGDLLTIHLRALHWVAKFQLTLGWLDRTEAERLSLSDFVETEFELDLLQIWRGVPHNQLRSRRAGEQINDIGLLNRYLSAVEAILDHPLGVRS